MNQSKRIDPLLKRAQEHEDAVARDLAERQRVLDTHLSRLDELRRYAEEYANAQMAATSPAQLLNRRAFLDRLDSAVEQQQATVNGNRPPATPSPPAGSWPAATRPCWNSWPPATARRKRW